MKKNNFWNDAARYGVIMALVAILFDVLGFYVQNRLLSLLSLVVFVLLLGYLTKRRVAEYGAKGYSYGQCLGFMVCVMLCAGFIEGAFMGVAVNWFFEAKYEAMITPSIAMLEYGLLYGRPDRTDDETDAVAAGADFQWNVRLGHQGRLFRSVYCGFYQARSRCLFGRH